MKKIKLCQICKQKTKTRIFFEDLKENKELLVCNGCYNELTEKGLPEWVKAFNV